MTRRLWFCGCVEFLQSSTVRILVVSVNRKVGADRLSVVGIAPQV
jgi:hypothetical protein